MSPYFPSARFGSATAPLPDWRAAEDIDDPDDEEIETPPDVIDMLGFDPAAGEETGDDSEDA